MLASLKRVARFTSAASLIALCTVPTPMLAQNHVVSPADLQQRAVDATQNRERNSEALNKALGTAAAQKALGAANLDSKQVKNAIANLSDAELAQLAARADKAQNDFAAGRISDRDLLLILVGIAALILIIVAVN